MELIKTASGKEATLTLATRMRLTDYLRAQQVAAGQGRTLGQWARDLILAALDDQGNEVKPNGKRT